jgi:hypothetical protein
MAPQRAKWMFFTNTEMERDVIRVNALTVSNHQHTKTIVFDVLLEFFLIFFSKLTWN